MKCRFCQEGETEPGTTTVTLNKDGTVFVLRNVPAQVCQNCGEAYFDDEIVATVEIKVERVEYDMRQMLRLEGIHEALIGDYLDSIKRFQLLEDTEQNPKKGC